MVTDLYGHLPYNRRGAWHTVNAMLRSNYKLGASWNSYNGKVLFLKWKIKAMIRNWYNHNPHPPWKPKGKEAHTQIDKHLDKARTVNRKNSSFPNRWSVTSLFHLFSNLNYKIELNRMYNGQLIIMLKTIYTRTNQHVKLKNHNRSNALERPVIDNWGMLKLVLLEPNPQPFASAVVRNIWSAWRLP